MHLTKHSNFDEGIGSKEKKYYEFDNLHLTSSSIGNPYFCHNELEEFESGRGLSVFEISRRYVEF